MIRTRIALALAVASIVGSPANAQDTGVDKDMTVLYIGGLDGSDFNHIATLPNGIRTYAFGTTSCNEGNVPLKWISRRVNIAQNIFRIMDGRIEQLGYSWLKLGFCALSEPGCGDCQNTACLTLGIGCADTYSSLLNNGHGGHGKADVDPTTGLHTQAMTSPTGGPHSGELRLDPNEMGLPNAVYIAEAQYVCEDDHHFGNGRNNVSWRELNTSSGDPEIDGIGHPTVRYECAIQAWAQFNPEVVVRELVNEEEPTAIENARGHYVLGYRAVDLGGGQWRYDYALQNLTSDQSAGSFSIPMPCSGITLTDFTYSDVKYHSGSPYSGSDWVMTSTGTELRWDVTESFATNPLANALRWGELYSFGFTADAPPATTQATIGMFKPGTLGSLQVTIEGPCGTSVCSASNYCFALTNSFDPNGASIGYTGSTSVAAGDMTLTVSSLPANQFGLFYYGPEQTQVPFGDGLQCVTGGEVFRLEAPSMSDADGNNARVLDYDAPPMNAGNGLVAPGMTWNFQYWFRDPQSPQGGTFNLSDALSATFCP